MKITQTWITCFLVGIDFGSKVPLVPYSHCKGVWIALLVWPLGYLMIIIWSQIFYPSHGYQIWYYCNSYVRFATVIASMFCIIFCHVAWVYKFFQASDLKACVNRITSTSNQLCRSINHHWNTNIIAIQPFIPKIGGFWLQNVMSNARDYGI